MKRGFTTHRSPEISLSAGCGVQPFTTSQYYGFTYKKGGNPLLNKISIKPVENNNHHFFFLAFAFLALAAFSCFSAFFISSFNFAISTSTLRISLIRVIFLDSFPFMRYLTWFTDLAAIPPPQSLKI